MLRSACFVTGCAAVLGGVALHLPMLSMAAGMGYELAGMPMDSGMVWGMGLIVAGIAVAGFGLVPAREAAVGAAPSYGLSEPSALTGAHWRLMGVLTIALVVDVMKPASLGFVVPGMMREYGIGARTVAWVPLAALVGAVAGSYAWGVMADLIGRRSSIVLSAVMFIGTSICGAMPSLWWNVAMCFLMGAAAGGMLPIAYALLAETMPPRHRGWGLVLIGGIGGVGGYLAASLCSQVFQPLYGWRVMWLLNVPTGAILLLLNRAIPESPSFLFGTGRLDEALRVAARYGAKLSTRSASAIEDAAPRVEAHRRLGTTLSLAAFSWGLVNFGLLLWVPADLAAMGYDIASSSAVFSHSALLALPSVLLAAPLYCLLAKRTALLLAIGVDACGILGLALVGSGLVADPVIPVVLVVVGSNASLAMLLPYAAESYAWAVRGRATGAVAAFSKAGGLFPQMLAVLAVVPRLDLAAAAVLVPSLASMLFIGLYAR